MTRDRAVQFLIIACTAGVPTNVVGQAFGPRELSEQSKACITCHREHSPALYQQWGDSKHFRANVGCYECHAANEGEPDAYVHNDQLIAVLVTPKDCARCHTREVEEFSRSRHAKALRTLDTPENVLAELVAGNHGFTSVAFPGGASAASASGCWQCHGSEVKVLSDGRLDPVTWPNTGIGRLNPDGSEGSCSACHARHSFAASQARHPDTCGDCHNGPDHAQKEIYEASKHGTAFYANTQIMNLDGHKWIVGEDYWAAPTCSTCHMSATMNQPVTHDVGLRISWNNRPEVSIRPEVADAQLDLPGADITWQLRRANMMDVCINCHDTQWIVNFYTQYDEIIELYNTKFASPGKELYELAQPLLGPAQFSNELDWVWYDLWHDAGRRVRHGASMMAPSFTSAQGFTEVAEHFYREFVPELRRLADSHADSADPEKAAAAEALRLRLDAILESRDHRWYLGAGPLEDAESQEPEAGVEEEAPAEPGEETHRS